MLNQKITPKRFSSINRAILFGKSLARRSASFNGSPYLFGLIIAILGGYVGGLLTYRHVTKLEDARTQRIEASRADLHGFWVFRTMIEKSQLNIYKNLEIYNLVALTVDRNFQISGVAYKWKERGSNGAFTYLRENRSKSDVVGSVVNGKLVLNLRTHNINGTEEVETINGIIGEDGILQGTFLTDAAFSSGVFCARKIEVAELEDLSSGNLDCDF